MKKKIIIIGAIAGVVATGAAFAAADNRVTSKDYVDAGLGTKQNTIPAAGTNTDAGTSVVMYTNNAGTVGERKIYSGTDYNAGTDANKLVTASALNGAVNNIPTIQTSKLVCANSPDCTLWTISDQDVYGKDN